MVALALSTLIFLTVTHPATQAQAVPPAQAQPPSLRQPVNPAASPEVTAAPLPAPKLSAPVSAAPSPPPPPPKPKPPAFGFARPLDVGKEMARTLAAQDFARAGSLAAAGDPAQADAAAAVFEKMMKSLGARAGTEQEVEVLGMVENRTRVTVPLVIPGQHPPMSLQLDVERDDRMGWKITRLELPKQLAAAVPPAALVPASAPAAVPAHAAPVAIPRPAVAATSPKPLFAVTENADALAFGSDFVRALLRHDFAAAQKFVDEKKVPAERLAGLCIVFEEGRYDLKPDKPLIITIANPEVSWIVAQVQSPSLQQATEFGLELERGGPDQPWKVVGLNLSEILTSFAASAAKMGVPYTPIVANPKGGESLALYFEYDQAALHPRAQKQLDIVAGILKSDPKRVLHIAGHTDAKGTDRYNLSLSQSRAETVKKQLVSLGVPDSQVVTSALGKAQPLGPNQKADGSDDPEGRSRNRRAEIFLDF